jgi:LPXTG-motif cell wall-anchored protein
MVKQEIAEKIVTEATRFWELTGESVMMALSILAIIWLLVTVVGFFFFRHRIRTVEEADARLRRKMYPPWGD